MNNTVQLPKSLLLEILKYQSEDILIDLFENLLISNDNTPLSDEELSEIESARNDYQSGNVIEWK